MMKITKRINELFKVYNTVFLVQFQITGGIAAYVQNTKDVDCLCVFWNEVEDYDVISALEDCYDYFVRVDDVVAAAKYENAILKLREQEVQK